jgi:hypothetical protein
MDRTGIDLSRISAFCCGSKVAVMLNKEQSKEEWLKKAYSLY